MLVVLLLRRLGYDRRALPAQVALTWFLLSVTYLFTDPAENINLAFGLGHGPQSSLRSSMSAARGPWMARVHRTNDQQIFGYAENWVRRGQVELLSSTEEVHNFSVAR